MDGTEAFFRIATDALCFVSAWNYCRMFSRGSSSSKDDAEGSRIDGRVDCPILGIHCCFQKPPKHPALFGHFVKRVPGSVQPRWQGLSCYSYGTVYRMHWSFHPLVAEATDGAAQKKSRVQFDSRVASKWGHPVLESLEMSAPSNRPREDFNGPVCHTTMRNLYWLASYLLRAFTRPEPKLNCDKAAR